MLVEKVEYEWGDDNVPKVEDVSEEKHHGLTLLIEPLCLIEDGQEGSDDHEHCDRD